MVQKLSMSDLVKRAGDEIVPFRKGEIIEVNILVKSQKKILADVGGWTLGIVPEKELSYDIAELKPGDTVLAYVLEEENHEGYVVLSLKRASRARFYKTLEGKTSSSETLSVLVKDANRGGLVVSYGPIEGFIPTSQLAYNHYPRVGKDPKGIIDKLRDLINKNLVVKVLNFDKSSNKVIFSEKEASSEILAEKLKEFKVGETMEGQVTAVVDFGLFVSLGEIEGLVHLSEISWERVDDPRKLYSPGDKIKVKVISIENNKISLSLKRLQPDPWIRSIEKLKVGAKVQGLVTKITPFGAFVQIENNLIGLVHISEIKKDGEKVAHPEELLETDKKYDLEILTIDPVDHKINLRPILPERSTQKKAKKI